MMLNRLIILLIGIAFVGCSSTDDFDDSINIEQIKSEFNNEFEVYEGSYAELKASTSLNYTVKEVGFLEAEDSLFDTKVENKQDSVEILISDKGDIRIEYEYYASGVSPIVPFSIAKKNHLVIRGKTYFDAEIMIDKNEKYVIEKMFILSSYLYKIGIDIPKEDIGLRKFIIFEPIRGKSYVIDLKNEAVYS